MLWSSAKTLSGAPQQYYCCIWQNRPIHYLSAISPVTCSCSASFAALLPAKTLTERCSDCEWIRAHFLLISEEIKLQLVPVWQSLKKEDQSHKKKALENGIQLKSLKHNWFFSTKQLHGLVFTGKHPTKKKQKTSVCLGFYWIHGSWYYYTVWRLSYQQSLRYRKVLRHQTTWKTIGVCRAFYNVHTWTGNRLLNSTQPPMHDSNSSGTETILTPTQSQWVFF